MKNKFFDKYNKDMAYAWYAIIGDFGPEEYSYDDLFLNYAKRLKESKETNPNWEDLKIEDTHSNLLWLSLVYMFGNYGVSPACGWIEKKDECIQFLEELDKEMHPENY